MSQAIPCRGHNVVCAIYKASIHWLPSDVGSWRGRSLFWVSGGVDFTVPLQQLLFWLRPFVPALPFLRLLLIIWESRMEKHSHKATGSFVSALVSGKGIFSDPYLWQKKGF